MRPRLAALGHEFLPASAADRHRRQHHPKLLDDGQRPRPLCWLWSRPACDRPRWRLRRAAWCRRDQSPASCSLLRYPDRGRGRRAARSLGGQPSGWCASLAGVVLSARVALQPREGKRGAGIPRRPRSSRLPRRCHALIGAKGRTSPLAEARMQCCEDREATFGHCLTCDQTRASANASVACGLPIGQGNTASILGDTYYGGFGSASQIAALADLEPPHVQSQNDGYSIDAADAIAMFQASDADVFDAECRPTSLLPPANRIACSLPLTGMPPVLALERRTGCRDHNRPELYAPADEPHV